MEKIAQGDWDDSIESRLGEAIAEAIDDFGPDFDAEGNPIEEGESDRVVSREMRAVGDGQGEGEGEEESEGEEPEAQAPDEDEEPGKEKDAEAARA
jgi:hypothetical protein